jgi:hypothetical protein
MNPDSFPKLNRKAIPELMIISETDGQTFPDLEYH